MVMHPSGICTSYLERVAASWAPATFKPPVGVMATSNTVYAGSTPGCGCTSHPDQMHLGLLASFALCSRVQQDHAGQLPQASSVAGLRCE